MPSTDVPHGLIGCSGLYNSPDPLLRRLRLQDPNGAEVTNIARTFADIDLLILYAGSAQGAQNLQTLHRTLSELMLKDKHVAVVYVSTDVDAKLAVAASAQQPWFRMVFEDDSDFAPLTPGEPEVVEVARGEEFVQAMEIETGAEVVTYGEAEEVDEYVRPLSRAGVGITMQAYATPSIAVYNTRTHDFVKRNARPAHFARDKVDANVAAWRRGEALGVGLSDFVVALKWPLIALLLAMVYHAMVYLYGQEYNVIPKWLDEVAWHARALTGRD